MHVLVTSVTLVVTDFNVIAAHLSMY